MVKIQAEERSLPPTLPENLREIRQASPDLHSRAASVLRFDAYRPARLTRIPSRTELALEGFVEEGDLLPEGPFGEFAGYYAGARAPRPVLRVEQVYERRAPIILGSSSGRPPFDYSYPKSVLKSALLKERLAIAGVPGLNAVWKHEAASGQFFTVVSVDQRYAGHAEQVGILSTTLSGVVSMGRYVVVVDGDIDVTDLSQVVWALGSRSDPGCGPHRAATAAVDGARPAD